MSRLKARFDELKAIGRTALIPYVTAGDPEPNTTVNLMHNMVQSGADIIELGVPFSDPMADGPTIQLACERALKHGTRLLDVLEMVRQFRETDQATPVVLMGYLNPIEALGYETFAQKAQEVGVDGVLTVDLPPEEAGALELFKKHELDSIFLVSPTTLASRIEKVATVGGGFLYYVSLKGVTGSNALDVDAVAQRLDELRDLIDLPLGVGFGIQDAETAAAVAKVADAVIVGSALIKQIQAQPDDPATFTKNISDLLASMRQAMDA